MPVVGQCFLESRSSKKQASEEENGGVWNRKKKKKRAGEKESKNENLKGNIQGFLNQSECQNETKVKKDS